MTPSSPTRRPSDLSARSVCDKDRRRRQCKARRDDFRRNDIPPCRRIRPTTSSNRSSAAVICNLAVGDVPQTSIPVLRSEEHTSELQSLMRISYAVFCLKKKKYEHTSKSVQ